MVEDSKVFAVISPVTLTLLIPERDCEIVGNPFIIDLDIKCAPYI